MNTKNSRPLRFVSALLGAGLSVALASAAHGDDGRGREVRVVQAVNAVDLTQNDIQTASAGVLVRSRSNLEAHLSMTGLTPFNAYTVYWMIYNRPENCAVQTFCNPVDLTDASGAPDPEKIKAVGGTVFVGSGFIASGDGTANVNLALEDGPLPIGDTAAVPPLAGFLWPGNGLHAFIIAIIRTHGTAAAGRVATQINQPEAGCVICFDQQAIIFGTAPSSH